MIGCLNMLGFSMDIKKIIINMKEKNLNVLAVNGTKLKGGGRISVTGRNYYNQNYKELKKR